MIRRLVERLVFRAYRVAARVLFAVLAPLTPRDPSLRTMTAREVEDESYDTLGMKHFRHRIKDLGLDGFTQVLDVGSGNGRWLSAFSSFGGRPIGVEPRAEGIAQTRKHASRLEMESAPVVRGAAEHLPIGSESVELYFGSEVLMYCDKAIALAEADRVLRPGGTYFLTVQGPGYPLLRMVHGLRSRDFPQFAEAFHRFLINLRNLAAQPLFGRATSRAIPRRYLIHAIKKLGWTVDSVADLGWRGRDRFLGFSVFYSVKGTKR